MRKALFALPLLASALILPRPAHAATISFISSGNIVAETFTNDRVTFTASAPEQQLLDAFAASGDNPASFATCAISSASVTIHHVGTFDGGSGAELGTCVQHNFTDNDTYGIFDFNLGFGGSVPLAFDSFQSSVGPSYNTANRNFNRCGSGSGSSVRLCSDSYYKSLLSVAFCSSAYSGTCFF